MNKAIIMGRLTKDVEIKEFGEHKLASFTVVTSKKIKGEEKASFHNVTAWNKQAEVLVNYSGKGKRVLVEGEINYETYEKDGQTKYITKINAFNVQIVDFAEKREEQQSESAPITTDDIPF